MTPFIVAELGASHNGSFDRAMALVEAAAKAGASSIKLQTYTPEQMCDPEIMIESGPWAGRNLLGLYKECHTPRSWHAPLFARAKELGMEAFSSVFHKDDVDFLETLGCPRYKISSFEILDIPLIRHAAATKKPLIISTGMATWEEISEAVIAGGFFDLTLLKCTSAYPSSVEDANLLAGRAMVNACVNPPMKWGLSDHTLGLTVPVAATALGASMIEKHLTLSRSDGGPDAAFSSEPYEFSAMVKACREAAAAIGEVHYGPTPSEMSSLPLRRKPGGKRGG
jgi:N-acetylneuraminate synthase